MLSSKLLFPIVSGLLLASCQDHNQGSSETRGHYENVTAEDMEKFRNKQEVIAEHMPVAGVILSDSLLRDYDLGELIVEISKAGVDKIWLTTGQGSQLKKADPLISKLGNELGSRINQIEIVPYQEEGVGSVWARDWAPLGAKVIGGEGQAEGKVRLVEFNYYPNRGADDASTRSFETTYRLDRVSVPVYNEGGNFMNNSQGVCMMTNRVIEANQVKYHESDMILTEDEIKAYYIDFAGCREVHIFQRMPYEGTGHIDMWAKFLDDQTILVSELTDETLATIEPDSVNFNQAIEIKKFLEERTKELELLGFKIIQIPMPAPMQELYRSYTNSLLVNGTAIIPQYVKSIVDPYADQKLLNSYEEKVQTAYEKAGFKVKFVPADGLIAYGGAIHCVTMQLPRL